MLMHSCTKDDVVNPTDPDGSTTSEPRVTGIVDCNGSAGGDSVKVFYRNGSLIEAKKTNLGGGFSFNVPANTELTLEVELSDASKDTTIEITSGGKGTLVDVGNIRMCESFDFTKISAGGAHCLALRSDGTIWAWGNNSNGQLGVDPTSTPSTALPVRVGNENSWIGIEAGNGFSLGLKFDGSLWAWGNNSMGQLGDGTTLNQFLAVRVGGTAFFCSQFAAGGNHALAIRSNGTLWSWGANDFGQLGNGTINTTANAFPIQIGTSNNWNFVSARVNNSGSINTSGQLFLWGDNARGQTCGNMVAFCQAPLIQTLTPTQEYDMLNWTTVSASCTMVGVTSNGELFGGGDNVNGQLNQQVITGQGSLPCNFYWNPIKIVAGTGWMKAVNGIGLNFSLGGAYGGHSLFLRSDGTLWGSGPNQFGALGNGPNVGILQQIGLDNDWMDIAAGAGFSLMLKSDGTVWSMGKNDFGQIGNGITGVNQTTPFRVLF